MITPPRIVLVALGLALVTWSCLPPICALAPAPPQSVCHHADAGAITPDASFALEGLTYFQEATCQVSIDGGAIDLLVSGMTSCGGSAAVRAIADKVKCAIPALPAGTYVVNSASPTTFTIPESVDAGVPVCP